MKILTGLSHEKNGGYSMALFGRPRIQSPKRGEHVVYVDCHIILAIVEPISGKGYIFSDIDLTAINPELFRIPTFTESKMRSYARKLARDFVKKRCWNIGLGDEYIQNNHWHGFYFQVV